MTPPPASAAGSPALQDQAGPSPAERVSAEDTRSRGLSPCINVCRMHAGSGWCEGCLRTIDEIAAWSRLDDAGKREVLASLPERRRAWRALRATAAQGGTP